MKKMFSDKKIFEAAEKLALNTSEALEKFAVYAKLDEEIRKPPDDVLKNFVKEEVIDPEAFVSPLRVKGTYHPDYQGITWREFFQKGKRVHQNLALLKHNPEYYLSVEPKVPTMYYVAWGDQIFIGNDGNHRTAIARAFFGILGTPDRLLGKVHLVSYLVDEEMWSLFLNLQLATSGKGLSSPSKRPFLVFKPERKLTTRIDAVGPNDRIINCYQVRLVIENLAGERLIIDEKNKDEAFKALEEHKKFLELPFWKKCFKKYFVPTGSDTQRFLLKALRT